jgi:hypothetical protein
MFEAYSHSNHEGLIAASCIEEVRFVTLSGHSHIPDGAMSPLRSAVSMPAGPDHGKPT